MAGNPCRSALFSVDSGKGGLRRLDGGRTRARTWDPMIKSPGDHQVYQWHTRKLKRLRPFDFVCQLVSLQTARPVNSVGEMRTLHAKRVTIEPDRESGGSKMSTTQRILCGPCKSDLTGPAEFDNDSIFTCPTCGQSDRYEHIVNESRILHRRDRCRTLRAENGRHRSRQQVHEVQRCDRAGAHVDESTHKLDRVALGKVE